MLSWDLHFLVFISILLFIFFEVQLVFQPPRFFNGSHCLASVCFLLGCEYSKFCETLIACAYICIFLAENSNTAKFDRHLEFMVFDRSIKNRHLDFDNVTDFYCTRCDWLESDIQQLYKVTHCFSYCWSLLFWIIEFSTVSHDGMVSIKWAWNNMPISRKNKMYHQDLKRKRKGISSWKKIIKQEKHS